MSNFVYCVPEVYCRNNCAASSHRRGPRLRAASLSPYQASFEKQRRKYLSNSQIRKTVLKPPSLSRGIPKRNFVASANRRSLQLPSLEILSNRPLLAATITDRTQMLYIRAYKTFLVTLEPSPASPDDLDKVLSAYIEDAYVEDCSAGHRLEMSYLIVFLSLAEPLLRNALGLSRRTLSGWNKLEPAQPALPLTRKLMLAFAEYFRRNGSQSAAVALCVQWTTYMRASEVLSLRIEDIELPGTVQMKCTGSQMAGIHIPSSKTGQNQFTPIRDNRCVSLLQAYLQRQPRNGVAEIFDLNYRNYNNLFKEAAKFLGLDASRFSTHSARIGGAFTDYVRGQDAKTIALTGRWKSFKSLQRYLSNGRAGLMQMKTRQYMETRVQNYSDAFPFLLEQCVSHTSLTSA
ncbi:Phage integrase [Gracilaria domingensis]|nr:Phage integrase [Gracilaria domingensis]